MDVLRFCPKLLVDRQAVFEQGTRLLQLAMLQVDESQQTERSGTVEDVVLFPKVSQALFGQLLGERLVLLRYKEQICQQEAHPAKALLIAQLLIEQATLREQSIGLVELTLFHSDARPFDR